MEVRGRAGGAGGVGGEGGVASAPMTSAEFKVGRASPRGEERELGGGGGAHPHLTSAQLNSANYQRSHFLADGAPCRTVEALISPLQLAVSGFPNKDWLKSRCLERDTAESGEGSRLSSDDRAQVLQRADGRLIRPESIFAGCRSTAGVNMHESYHTTRKQNEHNIRIFKIIH
ncbi:hypothetical protein AMECASPLE_012028 [Ameca splendens]|uniref:Uncharacterized protein n=1 Tax=Ameca splendens TaxID=208324 RepID=A0ABV0Y1E3_9TELE